MSVFFARPSSHHDALERSSIGDMTSPHRGSSARRASLGYRARPMPRRDSEHEQGVRVGTVQRPVKAKGKASARLQKVHTANRHAAEFPEVAPRAPWRSVCRAVARKGHRGHRLLRPGSIRGVWVFAGDRREPAPPRDRRLVVVFFRRPDGPRGRSRLEDPRNRAERALAGLTDRDRRARTRPWVTTPARERAMQRFDGDSKAPDHRRVTDPWTSQR
jgi:hypothetical protein